MRIQWRNGFFGALFALAGFNSSAQTATPAAGVPLDLATRRAAIVNDRNLAMRVHGSKLGRVKPADFSAGLDMPVFELHLVDQPHHFLKIKRAPPSPNCKH